MIEPRKKNPIISGVLSFILPGAGQFYNEEIYKGLILFAAAVASIINIIYSGISLGEQMINGDFFPPANYIIRIVASGLIFFGLWLYGIIDGIISAQRISSNPATTVEGGSRQPKSREGLIGLGIVLIILGIFGFLHQLGLRFEYIIKFGWPVALILLGLYLLIKTTGLIRGGK
ncbi:MAG: DUF5683 domain-containing protein [Bacillota bacterium]